MATRMSDSEITIVGIVLSFLAGALVEHLSTSEIERGLHEMKLTGLRLKRELRRLTGK